MRKEVTKSVKMVSNNCELMFHINHARHTVEYYAVSGRYPYLEDIVSFCLLDSDIRKELIWALTCFHRKDLITYDKRVGMSGCVDIKLFHVKDFPHDEGGEDVYIAQNYRTRTSIINIHISCAGKLNESKYYKLFSGDLLELIDIYLNGNYGESLFWSEYVLQPNFSQRSDCYSKLPFSRKQFKYLKLFKPKTKTHRIYPVCGVQDLDKSLIKCEYEWRGGNIDEEL